MYWNYIYIYTHTHTHTHTHTYVYCSYNESQNWYFKIEFFYSNLKIVILIA